VIELKSFSPARLTSRRKALGITQRRLAAEAHLSTVSVSNIENGKKQPRVCTIARLASALKCDIEYFFA
jgi:transcriptional regulator with XRE-family HTH domain